MVRKKFFSFFLVLKLNCLFPKIYHKKCNIILQVFFYFCLFVLCFCLFVCFFVLVFVLFLFFFFRLVCLLLFYFFVTNITFCIGYIQNWFKIFFYINSTSHCRHPEKSRRRHLFYPFLTVIIRVRFENQNILCNPDPKNNRQIKSHLGIRPRTDM